MEIFADGCFSLKPNERNRIVMVWFSLVAFSNFLVDVSTPNTMHKYEYLPLFVS